MTGTGGLEVAGLRVSVDGAPRLEVAGLRVAAGECAVLAAPGGAGKTLLAAALAGQFPAAGEVRAGGVRCTGSPARRRRAGLAAVVQGRPRTAGCSVAEALRLAARGRRAPAEALAAHPALAARVAAPVATLSGGEHQLLRVVCAWLAAPAALVLDAPTDGLAAGLAVAVRDLALAEAARGAAVLWLDQPAATLPVAATLTIEGGAVRASAAPGTGSSPPAAG